MLPSTLISDGITLNFLSNLRNPTFWHQILWFSWPDWTKTSPVRIYRHPPSISSAIFRNEKTLYWLSPLWSTSLFSFISHRKSIYSWVLWFSFFLIDFFVGKFFSLNFFLNFFFLSKICPTKRNQWKSKIQQYSLLSYWPYSFSLSLQESEKPYLPKLVQVSLEWITFSFKLVPSSVNSLANLKGLTPRFSIKSFESIY